MHVVALPEEFEGAINLAASWLKLGLEGLSIIIILVAAMVALARLIGRRQAHEVRVGLARGLSLALEFQLAADIVGTAVSPDWDQIGKLAAVAGIRTFLNYFLQRELVSDDADTFGPSSTPSPANPSGSPAEPPAGRPPAASATRPAGTA